MLISIARAKMGFLEFYGWLMGTLSLASLIFCLLITPPKILERNSLSSLKLSDEGARIYT